MLLPQAHSNEEASCSISLFANVRCDLRLLEVEESLLQDICKQGAAFKGPFDGKALLCTDTSSYALKSVETTNLLLLVDDAEVSRAQGAGTHLGVAATAGAHFETALANPRLGNLDAVLQATLYMGEAGHAVEDGARPPWPVEALLASVQASRGELHNALAQCGACELDGHWQVPSQEFTAALLHMLLLTAQHQGWPLTHLPAAEAITQLQRDGYDPRLVHHCLAMFGTPLDAAEGDAWALDQTKVCHHLAVQLLREQPTWSLAAFMQRWREAAPEGMEPAVKMLHGEALIDGETLSRFPASELPSSAAERFARLFAARSLWQREALEPYIADLKTPGQSADALLLSHARAVQSGAALLYGARYATTVPRSAAS